ncbi:MAG: translation initiation factor eIF-1A [Candidatus Micrarchaeaceae archaeon]
MDRNASIPIALKLPRGTEVVGKVSKIAGATRFFVKCADGKERICTIPGRLRRRFWIKINDVVIVKPWVVQSDERGDITWRYSMMDIGKLRAKGILANL